MRIQKIGVISGVILMIIGTLVIVVNPNINILFPLIFMSVGGYLFGISLATIIIRKKYLPEISDDAIAHNKLLKKTQLYAFSITGVIMAVTLIMCAVVL